MSDKIERRLQELGIVLPDAPAPVANYATFTRFGPLVQLAGVAPVERGKYLWVGKIGRELTLQEGVAAARLCAVNLLANLKIACDGDLDRVQKFFSVRGFVNADESFEQVPAVVNGASDLIVQVFGHPIGAHARTSIGCATLPGRVAVEVDAQVIVAA